MIRQRAAAWPIADADSSRVGARAESTLAENVAFYGIVLLAIAAPFETQFSVVTLPGQSISNVEACLVVVFVVWIGALAALRTRPIWRTPLTWPWLVSIAAMATASMWSPISKMNAL